MALLKGDRILKCGISFNEYTYIHRWLTRNFGKANRCENDKCPGGYIKYQYALKKGFEYAKNREAFRMLCIPCHKKYDWKQEFHKKLENWTEERKAKISAALIGTQHTQEFKNNISKRVSGEGNPMYGVRMYGTENHFFGKKHSQEAKNKMSESAAKISIDIVLAIRKDFKDGIKQKDIATKYNLLRPRVCKIIKNQIFKQW